MAVNCDLVKESMGSVFFLASDRKKRGKKEATSQKMKASLEHVETEFQLGWPPHDPSVCSDVQCFMSLDWLLRLTIWQKNQSRKDTENSSIAYYLLTFFCCIFTEKCIKAMLFSVQVQSTLLKRRTYDLFWTYWDSLHTFFYVERDLLYGVCTLYEKVFLNVKLVYFLASYAEYIDWEFTHNGRFIW